jgi:hypothetical protein
MKLRPHAAALFLGTALLPFVADASAARAQETPPLMVPLPQHTEMARDVGVWDAETTAWATPDAEPEKSTGVETNRMIGKMWLASEFKGTFMGGEFVGEMQFGYDPLKKKYVGTWIDSISPFLFTIEGEYDVATHTLTCLMTGTSALTGKPETAKNVTRYIDENTKTFEMYMPVEGKEGEWWKTMEIAYTRRK